MDPGISELTLRCFSLSHGHTVPIMLCCCSKCAHWALHWAPVSGAQPGYTYHCGRRDARRALTLTARSRPYLDTASEPACHLKQTAAIHSLSKLSPPTLTAKHTHPRWLLNESVFTVKWSFCWVLRAEQALSAWRTHARTRSYKQQHKLSGFFKVRANFSAFLMNRPHVPGCHGDVVESEPCGDEGAFCSLLVVVFLLLNRAVLLAGRHGTGGREGNSGRELTAVGGWKGGAHPSLYPPREKPPFWLLWDECMACWWAGRPLGPGYTRWCYRR